MKVYEGPGMIADKAEAMILPIRVDGTQFTVFSKVRRLMRAKFVFRRKITVTILPPVKLQASNGLDNRERRKMIGESLYDIMSEMIFESSNYRETLFQSLINASKVYGSKTTIFQDVDNNSATYQSAILKAFIIGNVIKSLSEPQEKLGLNKLCRLGRRHPAQQVLTQQSPRGETMYWIGSAGAAKDEAHDTDFYITSQGHVSLTPLQVDLTDHDALPFWRRSIDNWTTQA
jgi:hypothetical protein